MPPEPVLPDEPDRIVVCDVSGLVAPDVVVVGGALVHLQLVARRRGRSLHLRGASARLLELLELCGLSEVLPVEDVLPADDG